MTRPGLVIFDCDGTLVDTEGISAEVMARFVRGQGWAITPAEVRERFLGFRLPAVQAAVEEHTGRPAPAGWLDEFQAERVAAFHRGPLTTTRGAAAALRGLAAAEVAVCVASNAILEKTRLTLGITGLAELIDPGRLFSATQVAAGKPAPDLFLFAAQECGHAAADCVVVEDSPTGLEAAHAAGMRVFGYAGPGGGDAARLAAAGGEVVVDLRDVVAAVAG